MGFLKFLLSGKYQDDLIFSLEDIGSALRNSAYKIKFIAPIDDGNKTYQRVSIIDGALNVTVTRHGKFISFSELYKLKQKFNFDDMQQWNFSKNFASYIPFINSNHAMLRHDMLIEHGIPKETFLHFLATWRDLDQEFQKHCNVTAQDRVS